MNRTRGLWLAAALLFSTFGGAALGADADADYKALLETWKGKEYDRALGLAEAFDEANPDHRYVSAALYMGGSAGLRAKRYGRAEVLYRELIRRFPDYKKTDGARNELVTALSRARKLEACIEQCDANLAAAPGSKLAHRWVYMKGETLFRMWRFAEAGAALEAFVAEHPDSSLVGAARSWLARIDPHRTVDENGIVAGYAGKYVDDVRFRAALAAVPGHVAAGYAGIEKRLGVDLRGKLDLLLRFEDAGEREVDRGSTSTIARRGRPAEEILFRTEYVVLSPTDFRSRIRHEMKHAGFRQIMGQGYLGLPRWVKEGLAVYAAEQLPPREAAILGNAVFSGRDPLKLVKAIADPDFGHDDYLAATLAFEWLESRKRGNVKRFTKQLLEGEDHREAFADLSGLPPEKAMEWAKEFADARVRKTLGAGYRVYLAVRDANFAAARKGADARNAWLAEKGEAAYKAWLAKHRGHLLEPNARYRLGKAYIYAGRYEEGRAWLRKVVAEDFDRSSVCDDAAYWIAHSFERQAREAYGVLLRDYSWATSVRKNVQGDWKAAGPITE